MMAKRSVFQLRLPRAKMPKLNITISSSQQGPSNMSPPQRERVAPIDLPQPSEDMWPDDDDDELILLASQAAEKVEANAEIVLTQAMGSNPNYDRFRMEVQSSTQLSKPNNVLDDFMGLDEDVFAEIPDVDIDPKTVTKPKEKPPAPKVSEDIFATPSTSAAAKNHQKMENAKIAAQNTFLSNRLRDQKKEIENLKEALAKMNERCQTKEGEASTMRYEMEMNKQQCDRLRKEKITELEHLEKNYVEKVAKLQKTVEKQQTEIQFKNMEILNKKSRRSLNETMPPPPPPGDREPAARTKAYNLLSLDSKIIAIETPVQTTSTIFELDFNSDDAVTDLSAKDATFLQYLNYLQRIYNQIDRVKNVRIDDAIVRRIFALATEFITFLYNYALQSDNGQDRKYDASAEYKQLSQTLRNGIAFNRSASRLRCLDDKTCVDGEQLVFERRLLAALSLLCSESPSLTMGLLDLAVDVNEGDVDMENDTAHVSFVDLLAIALTNIAFLRTSHLHKGLIEASSVLLNALASNYTPTEKRNTSLLNLFMAIVYCKPDIIALHQLTKFLAIASKQCCNQLCRAKSNDILNFPRMKIRRFSSDTCPLQVFASLLEVLFQPYEQFIFTPEFCEHISILTQITIGLMAFLRNCFKRSVDWLFRRTDCGSDADSICYCYCYIVSATIVLLHLCIKFWMEDQRCIDTKTIEVILKMAALFLQDNFKLHYEARVLQLGGMPIKNRLQSVYDSIAFFQRWFRFRSSHSNAIKLLDLRRQILMNEPQRVPPEMQQRSNQNRNGSDNVDDGGLVFANTFEQFSIKV